MFQDIWKLKSFCVQLTHQRLCRTLISCLLACASSHAYAGSFNSPQVYEPTIAEEIYISPSKSQATSTQDEIRLGENYKQRQIPRTVGMFTNDSFWDGKDRWRTGSYQRSWLFDDLRSEIRFRAEYITPSVMHDPSTINDRNYASVLSLGYNRRFEHGKSLFSLGTNFDFINQSKSSKNFHKWIHGKFNYNNVKLNGFETPSTTRFSLEGQWWHDFQFEKAHILPFVETKYGTRNMITSGVDFVYSPKAPIFLTREQTTGNMLFEYDEFDTRKVQWGFTMGADVSYVPYDYFIENNKSNVTTENWRYRARFGVFYQHYSSTFFVGPSYLSPEFKEQDEGQILQTIRIELQF